MSIRWSSFYLPTLAMAGAATMALVAAGSLCTTALNPAQCWRNKWEFVKWMNAWFDVIFICDDSHLGLGQRCIRQYDVCHQVQSIQLNILVECWLHDCNHSVNLPMSMILAQHLQIGSLVGSWHHRSKHPIEKIEEKSNWNYFKSWASLAKWLTWMS